jgi:acylglycerol lipase
MIQVQGHERFQNAWKPDTQSPWCTLTIVHGFGDHGGRFAGMGTTFASMGIGVQATDLVGHGRSPGRRGCIASYDQLLDDVCMSLQHTLEEYPRIPHFMFGQSMGGNLLINLALRRPEALSCVQGIVVGSPMLKAGKMPKERIMDAGRWLATKLPNWRIKAPVEVSKLSSDRRAQDAYLMDRWVHRNMSLRLATSLIDSGLWALEHADQLRTRMLVMHGLDDTLTCPMASKSFAESSNGMALFKGWSGCRHDLHDELQRERVFDYMTHWMKQQCITSFKFKRPATQAPLSRHAG